MGYRITQSLLVPSEYIDDGGQIKHKSSLCRKHCRAFSVDSYFVEAAMEKVFESPIQKREEINSSNSPHSSAVSLDRDAASSSPRTELPAAPPSIPECCNVDRWKRLLLPNLHCRHEFDKSHCHGRSASALPEMGRIHSTPNLAAGIGKKHSAVHPLQSDTNLPAPPTEKKTVKSSLKNGSPPKKKVSFHGDAQVREYPLIVGDVVTPNYDGCANCGIPLSLGWEFEEKVVGLTGSDDHPKKPSRTVDDMMLNAKQRVEKLKTCGGYTDRELWKVQRDLTARDRQIFFSGNL